MGSPAGVLDVVCGVALNEPLPEGVPRHHDKLDGYAPIWYV